MLIVVAAIILIALIALLVGARWWTWRPVIHQRVLVQLDSGLAIAGVVLSRRGPLLVLGDVTVHASKEPTRADGSAVIERRRVVWMQVI